MRRKGHLFSKFYHISEWYVTKTAQTLISSALTFIMHLSENRLKEFSTSVFSYGRYLTAVT